MQLGTVEEECTYSQNSKLLDYISHEVSLYPQTVRPNPALLVRFSSASKPCIQSCSLLCPSSGACPSSVLS